MIRVFASVVSLNIFSSGMGALLLLALGSLLPPEMYAHFVLIQLAGQALFAFGADWSNHLLQRYGHEEFLKTGSLQSSIRGRYAILVVSLPVAALILWLLRPWILPVQGMTPVALSAVYAVSLILLAQVQYLLQAVDRMSQSVWLPGLSRLVALMCLGILSATGRLTGTSAVAVLIAGGILSALWGYRHLRPVLSVPPSMPIEQSVLWKYSIPIAAVTGLGFFQNWLSVLLVNRFCSLGDTGVYAYAQQMVLFTTVGLSSTTPILINHFVGRLVDGFEGAAFRNFALVYLHRMVFGWNLLLIAVLGIVQFLFAFVLPPEYLPGKRIVDILLPSVGVLAISTFLIPVIHVYSLTHHIMWMSLAAIVGNLAVSFHLAPKLGMVGLAWGMAAGTLSSSILYAVIAVAKIGTGMTALVRSLLAALPLAFFCMASSEAAGFSWAWIGAGAAAAGLYLGLHPPGRQEVDDWKRRLGLLP